MNLSLANGFVPTASVGLVGYVWGAGAVGVTVARGPNQIGRSIPCSELQLFAESSVIKVDPDIPCPAVGLGSCEAGTGFGPAVNRRPSAR
jgi:hypothetical protein